MTIFERFMEIFITVVLIVGGYQFYFWAQRNRWREARYFETSWDARINFDPRWVWIYSGLYYPMILLATLVLPTWRDFAYTVGCFLLLLAVQVTFFVLWPVAIPLSWRTNTDVYVAGIRHPRSMDMLEMVWSYDKLRNSLPSMHVSVAMMVDLTIGANWPLAGYFGLLFPILIATSALKTKQHYVVDVVPGAALGAAVFFLWRWMTA